jgi:uncharacterized lipoprotein YddW (UPF0748 family)
MRRITSVLPILLIISLQTSHAQTPTWRPKPQTSHDLTEDVSAPQLPAPPPPKAQKQSKKHVETAPPQIELPAKPAETPPQYEQPVEVVLEENTPKTPHELRGVWVSTVQRVDFPSKESTDPVFLKKEWDKLLKFYKSLNLNAVIVQIRPTGDAIYPSKIVPYSQWLTGKSGRPLAGNADLLKYMIETSHTEGVEFHAWINPYRVIIDGDTTKLDPKHPFRAHRNWVLKYGREYLLNPGIPAVRAYLTSVVEEIVQKYDIDAIHFDDYFYPYRLPNEVLADDATFAKYGQNFDNKDDWRRANTDSLISNIRQVIKKHKPNVQLGVSPNAVWRNLKDDPTGSDTHAYQRSYDDLYADVRGWIRNGWLDYVAPEIYFHRGFAIVDYEKILDWWTKNSDGTRLYISHAVYKINHQPKYPAWSDPSEIPQQLMLARSKPKVEGLVFFSSKSLMDNPLGVTDVLKQVIFLDAAKLPPLSILPVSNGF